MGGFTGPLPAPWATWRGWPKDELRSVIQDFNLVIVAGHLPTGAVRPAMWPAYAWVAPALLLPVLMGARLYAGLSPEGSRHVALGLLALIGLGLLAQAHPAVLERLV